jgi:hypothetical protein
LLKSISVCSGAQTAAVAVVVSSGSESDLEEDEEVEDAFFLVKGVVDLALHIAAMMVWVV